MSTRIELMKSRMRAKLLAAQTEDEADMYMDIDADPPTVVSSSQEMDIPIGSQPSISNQYMESPEGSLLSSTQNMDSPAGSQGTIGQVEMASVAGTPERSRDVVEEVGLQGGYPAGYLFSPQATSSNTPMNSQDRSEPPSPAGSFEKTVGRRSNSSEDSSDTDQTPNRRRPIRFAADDELCYAGDESSGIESPALKRMKTANKRTGLERTKRVDYDLRFAELNSSNSLYDSTDETKIRFYVNPYYIVPGPKKQYERALRFSLCPRPPTPEAERNNKIPDADQLVDLYTSLGMYDRSKDDSSLESIYNKFRLDAILVRGTSKMSSDDIFGYFFSIHQNPVKLEWVNDLQCIVVFEDKYEAGACLWNQTKPIDKDSMSGGSKVPAVIEYDKLDAIPAKDILVSMPPSHTWRYSAPSSGTRGILMTIAKKSDKKQQNAEEVSEYYRKHGNPNRGGGLWTKRNYDQRGKSRQSDETSSSSSTVQRFEDYRPPIHTRLNFGKGVSRKRTAMDEEADKRGAAKVSRRFQRPTTEVVSRNLERGHGDSSSDLDSYYDRRQLDEEMSDNQSYESSRQSTTYEDEEQELDYIPPSTSTRHGFRGRDNGNGPQRGQGSIKDRLW